MCSTSVLYSYSISKQVVQKCKKKKKIAKLLYKKIHIFIRAEAELL